MNAVTPFAEKARIHSQNMALLIPGDASVTFGELSERSRRMQKLFIQNHLKTGDRVVLLAPLSPSLYAAIIALLSLGVSIIFVEPWMKVDKIKSLIHTTKPRLFIYEGLLPWLWGKKSSPIRKIPQWISLSAAKSVSLTAIDSFILEKVPHDLPGIITFTTGTTGTPKGVIRTQGYLQNQYEVFAKNLEIEQHRGPDLCIFANFALAHLTAGRGSILIPAAWKKKDLHRLRDLSLVLQPESLTCGPAFLLEIFKHAELSNLKSLHVGGAQTDNWIFEQAFTKWPNANIQQIYGSSEAEPVALTDARLAVKKSKAKNLFQTLYLGTPVSEIQSRQENDSLWIAGPHVCPEYWGGPEAIENLQNKKRINNQIWHNMGDRIHDEDGWWYAGRSHIPFSLFELEQKIYSQVQRSDSFIYETKTKKKILLGQKLKPYRESILKMFPEIDSVYEIKIERDVRHRARVDRQKSILKGIPWLLGSDI